MSRRQFAFAVPATSLVLCLMTPAVAARHVPPPDTYSLTQVWAIEGTSTHRTVTVYRDGNMVTVDQVVPVMGPGSASHSREVVDTRRHLRWDWDVITPGPCPATPQLQYGKRWVWTDDPFDELAQDFGNDLTKLHPRQLGDDTVAGLAAKVMEVKIPGGSKAKIWVNDRYGLLLKMAAAGQDGRYTTVMRITHFSLSEPPASVFVPPARCLQSK